MATLESCKKCDNTHFYLRKKGDSQVGKYCKKCDAWSKWVGKKDLQVLQRNGVKVQPETYVNIDGESVGNYLGNPADNIGIALTEQEHEPEYHFRGGTVVPNFNTEVSEDELPDTFLDTGDVEENEDTHGETTPSTGGGLVKGETYQMKQETEDKPCHICSVGVVALHSQKDEVKLHIVGNSLMVYDNTLTKMLASTTLKYCFNCGKPMK